MFVLSAMYFAFLAYLVCLLHFSGLPEKSGPDLNFSLLAHSGDE